MHYDWLLVVVVLCALEGAEQLNEGDIVLCRNLGGAWRRAGSFRLWGTWHVVNCWPVLSDLVVLRARDAHLRRAEMCSSSVETSRFSEALVLGNKACGIAMIAVLGFFVPRAIASGALGLIFGFCVLACLSVGLSAFQSVTAWAIASDLSSGAIGRRFRLSSPFSLPSRSQRLFSQAVVQIGPVGAVRRLLQKQQLIELVRLNEWDRLSGVAAEHVLSLIGLSLSPEERLSLLAAPAHILPGEKYCPRCSTAFVATATRCALCSVNLVLAPTSLIE